VKRGKALISGGEAHSGLSPWGYKKPRSLADKAVERLWSGAVGHSALTRQLSGWGVERLESWQVGSWSPSDRWKVRQRNQGSQSERGARGVRATDPEAVERETRSLLQRVVG